MSNAAKSRIALWLVIAGMCCIAFALGEWRGIRLAQRYYPPTVRQYEPQAGDCYRVSEQLIPEPIECPQ